MSYIKLHPIKQFDFQINRILTYGPDACDINEIKSCVVDIKDLSSWYVTWKGLGDKAEAESQYLHAAYYYRLAEFFLTPSPEKEDMYNKSITDYYKIIDKDKDVFKYNVPYQGTYMKTLLFKNPKPKGNIVVFGGYDSFIEEFYLAIKELKCFNYNIYLFEGPGQGKSLRNGLFFEPYWEKPLSAILDYFNLTDVTVIGISWGGYLALRSAAFERRISNAIAYDVLYDGFDCMTHPFPYPLRLLLYFLFAIRAKSFINFILNHIKTKYLF
jgi:pimeloyl-ACP methyl ester carboxylesterase